MLLYFSLFIGHQIQGVTVSLSNVSDSSRWQSSPIYDCVTLPDVSPPPPDYMYKITCHQMASAVILHRDNNQVIGLMEIEVYSQEGNAFTINLIFPKI